MGVRERLQVLHLQDSMHSLSPTVRLFPDANILLGKTPIKVVKEAKFLCLILDTKLTFKNHVQYIQSFCQKALDILRVVGHTDLGANRVVLLRLYRALVRSKLDYGSFVYGSARRSVLKQLDHESRWGLFALLLSKVFMWKHMNHP